MSAAFVHGFLALESMVQKFEVDKVDKAIAKKCRGLPIKLEIQVVRKRSETGDREKLGGRVEGVWHMATCQLTDEGELHTDDAPNASEQGRGHAIQIPALSPLHSLFVETRE